MLFTILCIVGLALGIFFAIWGSQWSSMWDVDWRLPLGIILCVICGSVGIILGVVQGTVKSTYVSYTQDKALYENAIHNMNLTADERASVLRIARTNNEMILTNRAYKDSLWWGWFYPQQISTWETFDISKIPYVDAAMTMTLKGGK
jgi:hypothetical protein